MRISLDTTNLHGCFRILSAAAEADNLKLLLIQFQIASIKRKICVFTILAQMLPFAFLHTGGKLHFYSLGTTVRRKLQVSRGMQSLWLWVSNRGEKRPVGTRFCSQSLVCYTSCSPGDAARLRSSTCALLHHLHPKNEYPQASRACKYSSFCCRRKRSVRYGDSPFPASAVAKGITH